MYLNNFWWNPPLQFKALQPQFYFILFTGRESKRTFSWQIANSVISIEFSLAKRHGSPLLPPPPFWIQKCLLSESWTQNVISKLVGKFFIKHFWLLCMLEICFLLITSFKVEKFDPSTIRKLGHFVSKPILFY